MLIQSILYGTCAATPNMIKKIVKYFIRRHNEWTFSLLDAEYFSTLNNLKKEIKKKFLKMLLCISFSCKKLLSPHLLQGIFKEGWGLGRNGRWVAGGGGKLESPYFIDWLFPNNNKSLLLRVLFTPVSFIVSLFL